MQEIGKLDVRISVIPNGLEKYKSFTINKNLFFIGNMQYMNSMDFEHLPQEFSSELLELVKQKCVYPNEYINSLNLLFSSCFFFFDNKLPNRREFFSYLKDESVSEKDCLHAIGVWIMNKMKAMDVYHDLYLKKEIFILVDVFESFVSMCLEYSRLGPCHCFSNPGLS